MSALPPLGFHTSPTLPLPQIMVEDPYFNEPNVEAMRSTPEGAAHSATYNAELQLGTLRWAMIDILKHPPPRV